MGEFERKNISTYYLPATESAKSCTSSLKTYSFRFALVLAFKQQTSGECCHCGLVCCSNGLKSPSVLSKGRSQTLCWIQAQSFPFDQEFVPSCVCTILPCLQVTPNCECCKPAGLVAQKAGGAPAEEVGGMPSIEIERCHLKYRFDPAAWVLPGEINDMENCAGCNEGLAAAPGGVGV
jgi:hypothetical protein